MLSIVVAYAFRDTGWHFAGKLLASPDANRVHTGGIVLFIVPAEVEQTEQRKDRFVFSDSDPTFDLGLESGIAMRERRRKN